MSRKKPSRIRNEDQYTFTIETPPPPTEEELETYKDRTDQPHQSMQELMKGKSREEMLMAQDRMKEYAKLAMEIVGRQSHEEKSKETENEDEINSNVEADISDVIDIPKLEIPREEPREIKIRDTVLYKEKPDQGKLF